MSNPPSRQTIEGMASLAGAGQARRPAAAPVFKPELVRSLRMHPLVAAVTAAVVLVALLTFALLQKPVYEAESIVQIEPVTNKLLGDANSGLFDSVRYESFLAQQMQTAQRLDILASAIKSLPAGTWQFPGESLDAAATRLQSAVKTQRVATSYQVSFTLRGADPVKTAATLNAVVQAYLKRGSDERMSLAEQRLQILVEERQRVSTDLDTDRTEQARLSASLGMASAGMDVGNPYDSQLVGLRTELAAARESHDVAAAQLASVSGSDSTRRLGLSATAEEMIAGDAGLSSMKSSISQRRATLSGQMAGLTPENPIYKQDHEEIADLDRTIETASTQAREKAAARLQDKLRADLARTGDVEARLNAQLAQQTYAATSASPKLQRATELTADITRLMGRYAEVDNALRGLQLENSGPGQAHQVLAATPPASPVASRRKLIMLAAVPLALFLGALAAIFARKRDTRVYTGLDMEDLLGFPPIAVLPAPGDVSGGVMQEYVLRLAGGVESAFRHSGARTFVLTANSLDHDTDELGLSLTDRLRHLGLNSAIVEPDQVLDPALSHAAAPPTEALLPRSAAGPHDGVAQRNLTYLKSLHDVVFIRTAPLLLSAETEYMVRCSDATILVVQSGQTMRAELLQAATLLERLNVRGIAAVLDGLHLRVAGAGFRRAVASLERQLQAQPSRRQQVAAVTPLQGKAQPEALFAEDAEAAAPAVLAPVVSTDAAADLPTEAVPEIMSQIQPEPLTFAPEVETQLTSSEPVVPEPLVTEPIEQLVAPAAVVVPQETQDVTPIKAEVIEETKPASRSWVERLIHQESDVAASTLPVKAEEPVAGVPLAAPAFEPLVPAAMPIESPAMAFAAQESAEAVPDPAIALQTNLSEPEGIPSREQQPAITEFEAAPSPIEPRNIPVAADAFAEAQSEPAVQQPEIALQSHVAAEREQPVAEPLAAFESQDTLLAADALAEGQPEPAVQEQETAFQPEVASAFEQPAAEPLALVSAPTATPSTVAVADPEMALVDPHPAFDRSAPVAQRAFEPQSPSPAQLPLAPAFAPDVDIWPMPTPLTPAAKERYPAAANTEPAPVASAAPQKPAAERRAAVMRPASQSRWEPIPPLRGEAMPWRAPSGSRRAMHTREIRRQAESADPAPPALRDSRPLHQALRRLETPERQPGLTRSWGLLSRFENGKPNPKPVQPAADPDDRQDGLASRTGGTSRRS